MHTVPKLWPGETFICIGSGPSLTAADVDLCRGRARVIAVNDAYRLAPWADVLYACDEKWWRWQHRMRADQIRTFGGLKFGMQGTPDKWVKGVQRLKATGESGLELSPGGLRHGRNSGYAAINLAVHLGAARIVLLGYDMSIGERKQTHFFGAHADNSKPLFNLCLPNFPKLVKPLRALGIDVINCSRQSAINCFPKASLEQAIDAQVAA